MVDQTQTDKTIQAVADTAKATAATVEAVTQTAAPKTVATTTPRTTKTARKTATTTARKTTAKTRANAKTATTTRRARKVTAEVVTAAKKTNRRAVNSALRNTQAAATGATKQIERTANMTNDFTQMFAGFQLPGSDKFQGLFADAGARSQDLVAKSRNATEEMTDLAKANVEAIAEATRIAATGAKSIGQDVISSSRTGFEHASEAIKTLADAKSPTEFFQLQSELMRSSFDRMVSESSKLTEQMVKLAGEAIQPISNRASVNAERVNELMA
ncbi:MAG: phasin family protein [Sphingomonas bacterium]|nr:phasin family protein [Sphingomonas bacterium]